MNNSYISIKVQYTFHTHHHFTMDILGASGFLKMPLGDLICLSEKLPPTTRGQFKRLLAELFELHKESQGPVAATSRKPRFDTAVPVAATSRKPRFDTVAPIDSRPAPVPAAAAQRSPPVDVETFITLTKRKPQSEFIDMVLYYAKMLLTNGGTTDAWRRDLDMCVAARQDVRGHLKAIGYVAKACGIKFSFIIKSHHDDVSTPSLEVD